MRRPAALLALALATGGCARDESVYPSLAKRAVEGRGFAEPETPVAVATPDPALDRQIVALDTRLAAAVSGFDTDVRTAETRVTRARGSAVGSEAWLSAQEVLATLDDRRAQASGLVSDIDDLARVRAAALQPAYPALDALRTRAQAEVDRENAAADRLQATLPAA